MSKMTADHKFVSLGRWFLCDKESHMIRMHAEKWPKYGIQSCTDSTWTDRVTLIVAIAWLCAQCVNKMSGKVPIRDILKANNKNKKIINSFKKVKRKPSQCKVGLTAPGVRLLSQQSPIVYSLWNPPTDSTSSTYHAALVKASDDRIQCQIIGQDWAIQSPGEGGLAARCAAASWGLTMGSCTWCCWGLRFIVRPGDPVEGNSVWWSKGMDAQERQVLEKKAASAACADMYDDIDVIIEMAKNVQNRRKTSLVMQPTLFIRQKESLYSHLIFWGLPYTTLAQHGPLVSTM